MTATQRHEQVQELRARHFLVRFLIVLIATALALILSAAIFSGVSLENGSAAAILAALIVSLLNAILWPLIIRFALPITVLTLGIGVLAFNAAIVMIASAIDTGLHIDGFWAALGTAVIITLVTTAVTALLSIDDDGPWQRNVVARQARRVAGVEPTDVPGIFFLEIDGLAHAVVRRAIRDGNMPTVSRWLREGTHHLTVWETDWSSQTGACQAGLLHGNNHDMPAFRWWEKDTQRAIVTNHPKDASEIERRISNGKGLLYEDGASRANILSGDAPHSMLTMSTALDRKRQGRLGQDYYGYFASPYATLRTLVMSIGEVAIERRYAMEQVRRDVRPRIKRSWFYSLARAWATVVQLDLQVAAVVSDLYAGRPVAYTTFLAYDEVAHHSGVERPDTLAVLRKVDRQLARIVRAAASAPRPYRFVVLSDHGQSQGTTFLDRYGESLEDLVTRVVEAPETLALTDQADTSTDFLGAQLTEVAGGDGTAARVVRRATRGRTSDDAVEVGEGSRNSMQVAREDSKKDGADQSLPPQVVVMASGNLGHVTFPREPGRVTRERIEELHPQLLPALLAHEGIGFVLVRTEDEGSVVLGLRGVRWLDSGRVEGEDPLAPYGPNAVRHVARTDAFSTCPDLVLNSTYWEETDEVAAFEELVGSHGGMGGEQSFPFLLAPDDLPLPDEPLVGSEHVHRVFRTWLAQLGHEAYLDEPEPTP